MQTVFNFLEFQFVAHLLLILTFVKAENFFLLTAKIYEYSGLYFGFLFIGFALAIYILLTHLQAFFGKSEVGKSSGTAAKRRGVR
jgi:ABC-type branched-subunit amino acid transport system permease subunit